MKRTTVFIDERLLEEAIKLTGAKTRRQVITAGLRELVRAHHRKALTRELGTFDFDLSLEELKELRNAD
jgi:Arc/MetJ family transcription regulator